MDSALPGDISRRLDPALRHLSAIRTDLSPDVIDAVRESLNRRRRETARSLDATGVDVSDAEVWVDGSRAVPVRIYRCGEPPAPAVIYCHSGAFVLGNLDTDHRLCVEFARRGHCTVISVDYRLAPQHPFPAGIEDAAAVLQWAAANAGELSIDGSRMAVAGSSAGGALAASLAHRAAAGLAPSVIFQLLHQPVLDDQPTPSKAEFEAAPGFDGLAVELMWRHYLATDRVPTGAVPARMAESSVVAGALITCSELDPLRDEAIAYAQRLMWAGVATELHVFPGTCHGFDSLVPECPISQSLFEIQGAALYRALHPPGSGEPSARAG